MNPGRTVHALLMAAALSLLAANAARTASPDARPGEVIIKFKASAKASDRTAILNDLRADPVSPLPRIGASHARISGATVDEAIRRYRGHAKVEFIEPNYIYRVLAVPNDTRFGEMWPLDNTGQTGGTPGADISATQAWDLSTGSSSVLVAITDTGLDYTHPDLAANAFVNAGEIPNNGVDDDGNGFVDDVHGYDFVNQDGDPIDDHGHGTHVGGTIGAVGNNAQGVVGVNWRVRLLACKFLDAGGSGSTDAAVRAIDYAVSMGAKVINASWGGGPASEALRQAIERAGDAGAVFVAAAGNSGLDIDVFPTFPASFDVATLVAVAASDHLDQRASFSNYGALSVDLAAPGANILSTLPGGAYGMASGTSMAAPHVCGVLGLMFARFPGMTALNAKLQLLARVDPLPAFAGRVLTGGRLNAYLALSDPDSIPPGPIQDLTAIDVNGTRVTLRCTATGDDGPLGRASSYDLRYSRDPIVEGNFGSATRVPGLPRPDSAGAVQQFQVTGLDFQTPYHFALKALDEFGNASPLSNVATATTLGPPAIAVSPTQLSASLLTGQQATRVLTISNSGPAELSVRLEPRFPGAAAGTARVERVFAMPSTAAAASDAVTTSAVTGEASPRPYPLSPVPYAHGRSPSRGPFGLSDIRIANIRATNLRVLLLHNGADVSEIQSLLAGFPDLGTVDVRDGAAGVPSLAELAVYQSVMVIVNTPFADPDAVGDVLADYVDSGGGLVLTLASFIGSWDVRGRLRNGNYTPFTIGSGPTGGSTLGSFDAAHPIMAGVSSVDGHLLGMVGLTTGAELVASWTNSQPFVATKGSVAAVNIFVGASGFWSGDVPLLLHNALLWSSRGNWLTAEPRTAVVPSGGQLGAVVTFDANDLDGGDYAGVIAVLSDDPDRGEIQVPASLHVTGVADIAVLGDEISVQSAVNYAVDGALTQHRLAVTSTPAGEGSFDLEAVGDFGDFTESATLTVEGIVLGSVGATGSDCNPARGSFTVSADLLRSFLADGLVDAVVQNTIEVGAFCIPNRHTVRLHFREPSDHLDFGSIFAGATRERGLLIRNAGTLPLNVTIHSDQAAFEPDTSQFTLAPRTSRRLVVRFHPGEAVLYAGTLTLQSDDPDEGTIQIPMSGRGLVPPDVEVEPAAFEETLESGAAVTRTMTVRNQGGSDLEFTVAIEGPAVLLLPAWKGSISPIASGSLGESKGAVTTTSAAASASSSPSAPRVSTLGNVEYTETRTDRPSAKYRPRSAATISQDGASVLLIQDVQPWGTMSNESVLQANQLLFDVVSTGALAGTNLLSYQKVIVAADQPTSTYQALAGFGVQFNEFVSRGGTLEFHGAGWGFSGGDPSAVTLPGGMRITQSFSGLNHVIAPAHPLMAGMPATFQGNWANHGIFVNLPAGATTLVTNEISQPVYVTYSVGLGTVIASTNTLEHGFAVGNEIGQLLRNSIPYGVRGLIPWLSAAPDSGRVSPGASAAINLEFRSARLLGGDYEAEVVLRSNDPDETQVRTPATLHVIAAPDIALAGPLQRLESVQGFAFNGAVTSHHFVLPEPPVGDGQLELVADGDFGDFFESATLEIEGIRIGDAGRTGIDCSPALGQFVLSAADLARVAADGAIDMTVTNTFDVDVFCVTNQHTVRLAYSGRADSLDFGPLFIGLDRARSFTIVNQGLEVLNVEPLASSHPSFQIDDANGFTLAPGSSRVVAVHFRPTAPGPAQGSISIRSDDPDEPSLEVQLRGEGLIPPDIAVTPERVDQHLNTGETATHTLVIENTGGSDLSFEVVLESDSDSAAATARAVELAGGSNRTTVRARPPKAVAVTGTLASAEMPGAAAVATGQEGIAVRSDGAPAPGYRPVFARPKVTAGAAVLLVEDLLPWGIDANERLLNAHGIPFTTVSSSALETVDLSPYSKVIVASDQPTPTYQRIQSAMAHLSDYVEQGGTLEFHAAGWGSSGGDASVVTLPGGVGIQLSISDVNLVLDPSHPLMAGVPNPFTGTAASHAILTGIPPSAVQIAADQSNRVNLIVYPFGRGKVIASGQTLEFGFATGQSAGTILFNMIPFGGRVTPQWLSANPLQGLVPPGSSATVALHLDAAGLFGGSYEARVVVRNNDPDESEVTIPVHLGVTGAPDINVVGEEVVLASSQAYFADGAATTHALAVSTSPTAGGTLELEADGDFGDFFESATVYLEGMRIGEVGRSGFDCTLASGSFPITAEDLAAAAADGQLLIQVQNSIDVNAFCVINEHRVRVRYRGPADPLSFGSLYIGQCRTLGVAVENRGTDVLHLQAPVVTDPAFQVAFVDSVPTPSLAPGESRALSLTFCPLIDGSVEAQLILRSDDPDEPETTVRLLGEGLIPPDIAVAPSAIDQALLTGQVGARHLMVANGGGSPLTFRIEIDAAEDSLAAAAPVRNAASGVPLAAETIAAARERYRSFSSPPTASSSGADMNRSMPARGATPAILASSERANEVVIFFDDMEHGSNGWTHSAIDSFGVDQWSMSSLRASSGNVSWRVSPHFFQGSDALQSPIIDLTGHGQATLTFHTWYSFDDCGSLPDFDPDGGLVEVSEVGSNVWQQIAPVNGYPYVLDDICGNPLAFRPAYAHDSPGGNSFVLQTFDLSSFAGKRIRLRFHAGWDCGNCELPDGWFIDDVRVFSDSPAWVQAQPDQGVIAPGEIADVAVVFDATSLAPGDYRARLTVRSNDPDEPEVHVPLRLTVADFAVAIDPDPNTVNLGRRGNWLTGYLELPAGMDPSTVDQSSLRLNHVVEADPHPREAGDNDHDGIPDLTLKFPFDQVRPTLGPGNPVMVLVTGALQDGRRFLGFENVRVIRHQLTAPNGGEVLSAGNTSTVSWSMPSDWNGVSANLYLSTDQGVSWTAIASGLSGTSYAWQIPSRASRRALVRVDVTDAQGVLCTDASDRVFEIQASPTAIPPNTAPAGPVALRSAPNPFSTGGTEISFALPSASRVELMVYNSAGRRVRVLMRETRSAGAQRIHWDGRDERGATMGSGLYFLRLRTAAGTWTRRVTLLQ